MKKMSLWSKLRAYHLNTKAGVCIVLMIIVVLSVIIYILPGVQNNELLENILLALFTSLMVSILDIASEIYVAYKDSDRENLLRDLHQFGIDKLNKNKEEVIRTMLQECDKEIWISGYRLIMTNNIKKDIAEAIERGAGGIALLCPPWTDAFKLVYGSKEKVMDNYFAIFHEIHEAMKRVADHQKQQSSFDVFITQKPIFSDTYRVDQQLITGPYMHNKDEQFNRLMAKDFFSYNLIRKSELYNLVNNEFLTLKEEASHKLDWEKFDKAYKAYKEGDLNEAEKVQLFLRACVEIC